jgi:hypothetical protein
MPSAKSNLSLHAGDVVRVRPLEEILATLDERGRIDALPFMPEMSKFCGQDVRVYKSAHKTCDTIGYQGARKVSGSRAVHLEGLRCDGQAHGGCQARCLLFWKEEWLEPVTPRKELAGSEASRSLCTSERLTEATHAVEPPVAADAGPRYSCQATELNHASTVLPWWDLRQYVQDLWTGNVKPYEILRALTFWMYLKLRRLPGYRLWVRLYDTLIEGRGGIPFPFRTGSCTKTPSGPLGLEPGELVYTKTQSEILQTVNARNRNRGLSYDEEMVGYCGGTYRVQRRIERIINEGTGQMMQFGSDCVVLDGVYCRSRFKNKRLFCPRSIEAYWRELWLTRADEGGGAPVRLSPYQREQQSSSRAE